jgi:hypothetical protein
MGVKFKSLFLLWVTLQDCTPQKRLHLEFCVDFLDSPSYRQDSRMASRCQKYADRATREIGTHYRHRNRSIGNRTRLGCSLKFLGWWSTCMDFLPKAAREASTSLARVRRLRGKLMEKGRQRMLHRISRSQSIYDWLVCILRRRD